MDGFFLFFSNNIAWFWFAVMVLCIVVEAMTVSLTTIWFSGSALLLIFISLLKIPFLFQVFVFFVIAVALLIFTRPVLLRKIQYGDKTNVESLVGKIVPVIKEIKRFEKGLVKVDGILWSATALQNQEIPENSVCKIISIQGNTVVVTAVAPIE